MQYYHIWWECCPELGLTFAAARALALSGMRWGNMPDTIYFVCPSVYFWLYHIGCPSKPVPVWDSGSVRSSTVPPPLSPVVNIRCLIHPVQCQQFKRAQFVFLSTSISVTFLWVVRSHFSACVPSKGLKCIGISECDYGNDTTMIFWQCGALEWEAHPALHKMDCSAYNSTRLYS